MQHLVVLDVPGIKKYVFGTNRLVEIRGASALLDRLNRIEMEKCLKDALGASQVTTVFANGGAGQFVIEAAPDQLGAALGRVKRMFSEASGRGLRLVYGTAEFFESNYSGALSEAFLRLRQEKEEDVIPAASQMHTGYVRECSSCSGMASTVLRHAEEDLILCQVCHTKLQEGRAGKRHGLWNQFAAYLRTKGMTQEELDHARPQDFEEIGERCSARRGYTSVVYADGNAMGRLVKSIRTMKQFRLFSEVVDQSVREACHEALFANCGRSKDGVIPADILLLGGDDLIIYTTAEAALPFAVNAAERFTRKTQDRFEERRGSEEGDFFHEKLQGQGLTVSFGIAYGKSHTPFDIMLDQAEELLKSAKRAGSRDSRDAVSEYITPTYIDYHIASNYNQVRVSDSRSRHLQFKQGDTRGQLYQKPYSLEDAKSLLEHAKKLSTLPRSRLQALAAAVGATPEWGWMNTTLDCLKIYGRIRDKEQKESLFAALEVFGCTSHDLPWKVQNGRMSTSLLDLIEIAELIPRES